MKSRIDAMWPTYYGLGNHDYENNVNDCYQNGCASQAMQDLFDHIGRAGVDSRHNYQESYVGVEKYWGSQAYTKMIDNFVFIQLHNHYNYVKEWDDPFTNFERKEYRIQSSLSWLEEQLKTSVVNRKIPIINMHRSPTDSSMGTQADRDKFKQLVNEYNVAAIFFRTYALRWQGQQCG